MNSLLDFVTNHIYHRKRRDAIYTSTDLQTMQTNFESKAWNYTNQYTGGIDIAISFPTYETVK